MLEREGRCVLLRKSGELRAVSVEQSQIPRGSPLDVEILLIQAIDRPAARTIFLKGFEDGWIHIWIPSRTENAPPRRKCESVFDNLVERASREIPAFPVKRRCGVPGADLGRFGLLAQGCEAVCDGV